MSRFSEFVIDFTGRYREGRKLYIVRKDFTYHIGGYPSPTGEIVTVKEGYITDLCSTPRLAWWIINPEDEKIQQAAVIHDWLFDHKDREYRYIHKIFLEAMEVRGVPWWKRYLVYRICRWRYP